mmetsp:Transcript_12660/g.38742  ORF Transcript_12660/g.38742 Transcript_12660/m.38742 type:complete len:476 (+) Transcript_12660:47-1474(+)
MGGRNGSGVVAKYLSLVTGNRHDGGVSASLRAQARMTNALAFGFAAGDTGDFWERRILLEESERWMDIVARDRSSLDVMQAAEKYLEYRTERPKRHRDSDKEGLPNVTWSNDIDFENQIFSRPDTVAALTARDLEPYDVRTTPPAESFDQPSKVPRVLKPTASLKKHRVPVNETNETNETDETNETNETNETSGTNGIPASAAAGTSAEADFSGFVAEVDRGRRTGKRSRGEDDGTQSPPAVNGFRSAASSVNPRKLNRSAAGAHERTEPPRGPPGLRRAAEYKPPRASNTDERDEPDADKKELPKIPNVSENLVEIIMNEVLDKNPGVEWDDIAGLHFPKRCVMEAVIWPMMRPDIFTGLRGPPKGLLLFGPPGTGKTMIGKAIASKSGSTFLNISASSLTSKWVGEGEKTVRALFAVARLYQPAVIFIDEIDSLLTARTDSDQESTRRIKTEFLVQMDGAATSREDRVLVVGM